MSPGIVTVSYIGATILFILALGGLSHPETARRGNLYGIIGMSIALLATMFGVVTANYGLLIGGLIVKVGSRMVDSSLKTKLQRLQLAMKGIG